MGIIAIAHIGHHEIKTVLEGDWYDTVLDNIAIGIPTKSKDEAKMSFATAKGVLEELFK